MPFIDLSGKRFGKLVVLERIPGLNSYRKVVWICRCDCGNEKNIVGNNLVMKRTKSCGCGHPGLPKTLGNNAKHGMSGARLYTIWEKVKNRCFNKNYHCYHRYGGRGIGLFYRWSDFEPFRDWALSNGYEDHLTIDRIDNDDHYKPSNCQWLTRTENSKKRFIDNAKRIDKRTSSQSIQINSGA